MTEFRCDGSQLSCPVFRLTGRHFAYTFRTWQSSRRIFAKMFRHYRIRFGFALSYSEMRVRRDFLTEIMESGVRIDASSRRRHASVYRVANIFDLPVISRYRSALSRFYSDHFQRLLPIDSASRHYRFLEADSITLSYDVLTTVVRVIAQLFYPT